MNIQPMCRQAFALHQQGKPAEALSLIRAALAADPDDIYALTLCGYLLQTTGRIAEALAVYDRVLSQAPDQPPGQAEVWNNRGGALQSLKRPAEALKSFERALALAPNHAGALYNHGTALRELKRPAEALASFDKAIRLAPHYAEAHNNRAATLQDLNRLAEALDGFEKVLSLQPDHAEAWHNRGIVLGDLNRPDEALASFDKALSLAPDYVQAWHKRGQVLQGMKKFGEALASYNKARALDPAAFEVLKNIGSALCENDRVAEGFAAFTAHAEQALAAPVRNSAAPPHKALHDAQQHAYLAGEVGRDFDVAGALHLTDGGRLDGPVVNPGLAEDIEEQWRTGRPQLVVIDNILTGAALEKLRRFCWGSTIWRKAYEGGYLAALPEYGFASPLLAQIADELRGAFPAIFGGRPLHYLWGFKYDSSLSGIKLHADKAAVNVNFWITPDESNLDPQSGGLVVWDVAAPEDWDFRSYNGDTEASRDFLARNGAKSITVPYRANRAVIFDSDLFHETDRIVFKDGYLDRRINITLLYGRRTSDNR